MSSAAAPAKAPHKRHLKNYLINRRYQLQQTLVMVIVSAILMGLLGYYVIGQRKTTIRNLISFAAPMGDDVVAQVKKETEKEDQIFQLWLLGGVVGVLGFLTVFGIVMTHKVAGPIFKMTLYFHKMRDGDWGKVYNLRKGDQLVEFFGEFKDMHDALRAKQAAEAQRIGELLEALDKAGVASNKDVSEPLAALRQLKEQKEKSLGS